MKWEKGVNYAFTKVPTRTLRLLPKWFTKLTGLSLTLVKIPEKSQIFPSMENFHIFGGKTLKRFSIIKRAKKGSQPVVRDKFFDRDWGKFTFLGYNASSQPFHLTECFVGSSWMLNFDRLVTRKHTTKVSIENILYGEDLVTLSLIIDSLIKACQSSRFEQVSVQIDPLFENTRMLFSKNTDMLSILVIVLSDYSSDIDRNIINKRIQDFWKNNNTKDLGGMDFYK